jgi:phosphatidylinositol alpha-mannosyltransferase
VRIALACPYAWDAPGGVQVHVGRLAAHLRLRGHRTLILAPAGGPAEGVTVIGRPVRIPYNRSVAPICPDPRSVPRIRRALAAFGPDVVHVHEPFAPSTGLFAALTSPVPVVATFHAYAERSRALAAAAPLFRPVWRRLAVRIAVSEAAAEFVRRNFRGDVRIIPNGVDIERFRRATQSAAELPKGRNLLFVNRLEPRKGFAVAVSAFDMLAREFADLRLIVAGDGPERAAVDVLPAERRGRVTMLGNVPNDSLPPYHAAAEAFLGPAVGGESFGIVLIEAMAAGLAIAASDIPGYREVVRPGVDGLLVRPNDPSALADAVRSLLTQPELAERLRAAGLERAERFDWAVVTEEIEQAYRDAVATGDRLGSR